MASTKARLMGSAPWLPAGDQQPKRFFRSPWGDGEELGRTGQPVMTALAPQARAAAS